MLGPGVLARQGYGHDGKEFWAIARDPALAGGRELAGHLDRPAYRAQRILYPLLAAPWRLAGERALLWGLLLTNLVAIGVGGYAASRLALELGGPAWVGLAFALNPAMGVTVDHDGCDAVALAALVWSILLLRQSRLAWGVAVAAAAALAKEASLLSIGGMAVLAAPLGARSRAALALVPAGVAGLWGLYARWRLGWPGTEIREFALPFAGYAEAWRDGSHAAAALLPVAALTIALWWNKRSLLLAASVPYALIIPFLSANVLIYGTGSARAFGPAITLLLLELLSRRRSASSTLE